MFGNFSFEAKMVQVIGKSSRLLHLMSIEKMIIIDLGRLRGQKSMFPELNQV